MYVFTPEQHCLLSLSVNIWGRRGEAKRHGLRFGEETATELFHLDLAELFPGNVKIVPFNRREEGRIGADWAWAFVGPDGQWCQGMLVQAKRLDDEEREYPELYYQALSCHRFRDNAVRLQLHALAYNLANFMRTLALPKEVEYWSLTTLREKLVKIGAKVVSHGRYVTFQLAELAVPRELFRKILSLIDDLRPRPAPA